MSTSEAFSPAPLQVRYLQDLLRENLKTKSYEAMIHLSTKALSEFYWWKECSGVDGSRAGNQNFHKGERSDINPPKSGQYHCTPLPCQNGGNKEPDINRDNKQDMGFSIIQRDHSYSRLCPIRTECHSRLGVQEHLGFQRMETTPQNFPETLQQIGEATDRFVCFKNISPTPKVHEQEIRPRQRSHKCIAEGLGVHVFICVPTIQLERPNPKESEETQYRHDSSDTSMGDTTLVSPTIRLDYLQPNHATSNKDTAIKSTRRDTPSAGKQYPKNSGMAHLRETMQKSGISESASKLIISARSSGTRSNYNTH